LRGHASEFGVITGKGLSNIAPLLEKIETETTIPSEARETMALLGEEIERLDARLKEMDANIKRTHNANPDSKRLATAPGIGSVTALTVVTHVDPDAFESGRHFAAPAFAGTSLGGTDAEGTFDGRETEDGWNKPRGE
jgi:transposase